MAARFTPILLAGLLAVLAGTARGGDLQVTGSLQVGGNVTVISNLTVAGAVAAQALAISGSATNTRWVLVGAGTNDAHRGDNLRAAYAWAKTFGSGPRIAVLLPPGEYDLGAGEEGSYGESRGLGLDTAGIDLIGLVPARLTARNSAGQTIALNPPQCAARIYSCADATIEHNAGDAQIESVILENTCNWNGTAYWPGAAGILRHVALVDDGDAYWQWGGFEYAGTYVDCTAGLNGFGAECTADSGTFIDCVAGDYGFGSNSGTANGTFINCTGGNSAFGGLGTASGTFINCVGGQFSFGGSGVANGTFINCTGGGDDFGGWGEASGSFANCSSAGYGFGCNGTASGTFINCVGGWCGFGGNGGTASGYFENCTGGYSSFGGWWEASGTFVNCTGGDYSFGWLPTGTFLHCVGGQYSFGSSNLTTTVVLQHCRAGENSFGSCAMPSDDFNYNASATNTVLTLPSLPTRTNSLPSGSVWNDNGTPRVMP